jgi:hypothetical protein
MITGFSYGGFFSSVNTSRLSSCTKRLLESPFIQVKLAGTRDTVITLPDNHNDKKGHKIFLICKKI